MADRRSLEHLPIDVVENIVSYLAPRDLARCCGASRTWHQLFSDDIFWKKLCNVKLCDYLEKTACKVKPYFDAQQVEGSSISRPTGWRLRCLQEQHLWRNWKLGRYTREEIEFDCDDSISYKIKAEFVGNNYVFLHTTFNTEVWDVSGKPRVILAVPFRLVEMWERNLYKVIGNNLIVVQCDVVQVFKICLDSKRCSLDYAFFFDLPEEFSSSLTAETDLDNLYQEVSSTIGDDVEHVICGDYFVGMVTGRRSLRNPVLHIWNLKTKKKVKEESLLEYVGSESKSVDLKTSESSDNEVVVVTRSSDKRHYVIYNLTELSFKTSIATLNGELLLHKDYMCVYEESQVKVVKYNFESQVDDEVTSFPLERLKCWHTLGSKFLIAYLNELMLVSANSKKTDSLLFTTDFPVGNFEVVNNRFVIVHDERHNIKEIWENGLLFCKRFSFPPDSGAYRATNEFYTKIVLERANKLIVLNFW